MNQAQLSQEKKYNPLTTEARQKLVQSLGNRLKSTPQQRDKAHKRIVTPYTMITPEMQSSLNKSNSWAEVVQIHKKYHGAYDITLINAFLRLYNQEAKKMFEQGRLLRNLQFIYQGPRMRGAETMYQEWMITPQSSNQFWGPNDVIKIMGNIDQGLVDFYRSHIQFQIQVTPQMQPVGLIQIDNSAQSIISQTVLLSNQRQVQRIQQYDVLAAILTDLNYVQYVCESRSAQGIGFNSIGTSLAAQNASSQSTAQFYNLGIDQGQKGTTRANYDYVQFLNGGGMNPTGCPNLGMNGSLGINVGLAHGTVPSDSQSIGMASPIYGGAGGGSPQGINNWPIFNTTAISTNLATGYVKGNGRAAFVRSQYLLGPQISGYPDGPRTCPLTSPKVKNQTLQFSNLDVNGFNPTRPYQTYYNSNSSDYAVGANFLQYFPTPTCGSSGYTKPMCRQLAAGGNQPYLSATIPQVQISNGKLLPTPVPLARKRFRIPLISAILGILVPPDQFQLIPAAALKNLILQITLNPYAFFTSGYSDIHQFDSYGMQTINMQKRQWLISQFNWTWHLYTFADKQITANLQTKLSQGIIISSNYWQNAAQYQLQNGSYVRNSFQIPINCQSLAQIDIVFLSNEFQTKTFCRKQFRLSNNITSMQFKANGNFFPLQPIQGNAGNPETIDTTGDNWEFYQLLMLCNNYFMNVNTPLPKINPKNFAINGRMYDVNNKNTYMPVSLYSKTPLPLAQCRTDKFIEKIGKLTTQMNPDTALGQSWFHQNRYIGKAVFSYSWEPYGHSKGTIMGIDTRGFRQFDVTFNSLPTDVYPHDQTMLVFCRSNVVIKFSFDGIQVMGV